MKKYILLVLMLAVFFVQAGCAAEPVQKGGAMIANPWTDHGSMQEAEKAAGFPFGLPGTVAGYEACSFRTMQGEEALIEVVYAAAEDKVTVRRAPGEGQDISGVYGHDVCTEKDGVIYCRKDEETGGSLKLTLDCGGASWSVFAPQGLTDEDCAAFVSAIGK